jgi:hypothetical protein
MLPKRSVLISSLKPLLVPLAWVTIVLGVALIGGRPLRGQAPNPETQPDVMTGVLTTSQSVGQTFIPESGGLYRVDVYLSTKGQTNTGTVIFHLKRSPAAENDLATVRVNAMQIQDNQFQAFEFPPLSATSKGETLYFYLESPSSETVRTISAWGYGADLYTGGQAIVTSGAGAGAADLAFRVFYLPSAPERLDVVLNRLAQLKPSVLGWPGWYMGLGLVYLVLLFGLGWRLAREADDGGK